jgi:hypothetical protein
VKNDRTGTSHPGRRATTLQLRCQYETKQQGAQRPGVLCYDAKRIHPDLPKHLEKGEQVGVDLVRNVVHISCDKPGENPAASAA